MKKSLSVVIFFLFTFVVVHAQDYPDFGTPSKEDLELKDCPFDKGTASVVLIHEAFSYSEDGMQLITTHHIRIKILKQAGVTAANISIPFYREDYFERIINLEAMTINTATDGTLTRQKVEKKSIYTTKINDQFGEITFAFPSVKEGSIIEYQYESIMKNYRGLRDWYFQDEMPVMISRYHLKMLNDKQFSYRLRKKSNLEATVLEEPGKVFFEMMNVPALKDEPFMDARIDNIQRVSFQINNFYSRWGSTSNSAPLLSWNKLYEYLLNKQSFWQQLKDTISGTTDFIAQTRLLSSPEQRMIAVYDYVRKNMHWNNYNSKTSVTGVNQAWQNHEGTSGDINLLLINLLKKVDVSAYPILVSERSHGKVDTAYPYLDQFNSVFAIVLIARKKYFLNAADKYTPAYITPVSILNTLAFMETDNAGGLINVTNDSIQYKEGIYLDMKITEGGQLKGNALIKSQGYARIEKKRAYEKDKEEFKVPLQQYKGVPVTLDNFEVKNIDNDSLSLEQRFNFSIALTATGNYTFIPLNLFSAWDKNPFVSDIRFSNINLGYNKTIILNTSIELPPDYSLDEMPVQVGSALSEKDIIFSRQISYNKENNTIYTNIKIEFNKSYYEADFYPILKESFKKLFSFLNEQLVIRKK
ncbi:DUF3857 domain-containing protein [Ferruginibacter sp. SUN106]|uniref:DUF3857 domain-containing protein n=1 Tax=Ferruginibacter sp. SUN106 TaxID=2978348 RepID=UPI003D35B5CA